MKSNLISSYSCAFLPDGVLNLCCIYFPPSDRGSSCLLVPASSYFWHPWYVGGFKELRSDFFCSQSVGKIYLILEVVPLPSFTSSLHKHKQRRGEISGNNSGKDEEIAIWLLPCPAKLKWHYMSCRRKYSRPKRIFTPPCLLVWSISVLHWG